MASVLKQCVGIDCSKDELVVGFGQLDGQMDVHVKATKSFPNDTEGFEHLMEWVHKLGGDPFAGTFVVEATGVYHQRLAYWLHDQGQHVSVVLPNKANHFAKTLKVRTVTDLTACRALAIMGLEKKMDLWTPSSPLFGQLKQLSRERKRLKDEMTIIKNQKHAEEFAILGLADSLKRLDERLELCAQHVRDIEKEIRALVASDTNVKQRMDDVCTIKGVGLMTAVCVAAEADGFNLIRNVRQLVCYAGYDVVEKQSGTSVMGKPRISKKGNSYIRRALYFPAITAVKNDPHLEEFYNRLLDRHGIKMKGYTAVQRKLLTLIYTLWTKQEQYDPDKYKNTGQPQGLPCAS